MLAVCSQHSEIFLQNVKLSLFLSILNIVAVIMVISHKLIEYFQSHISIAVKLAQVTTSVDRPLPAKTTLYFPTSHCLLSVYCDKFHSVSQIIISKGKYIVLTFPPPSLQLLVCSIYGQVDTWLCYWCMLETSHLLSLSRYMRLDLTPLCKSVRAYKVRKLYLFLCFTA